MCSLPLLLSLLFVSALAGCPTGYTFDANSYMCYQFHHEPQSYFQAQFMCTLGGGNLATIVNAFANSYILAQLQPQFKHYHIGIQTVNYPYAPNMTRWIDGSAVVYLNYAPNEPNGQKCGAMLTATGKWVAETCANVKPFVCTAHLVCAGAPMLAMEQKSCEDGWTTFGDSCYKKYKKGTFDEAQKICNSVGASLALAGSDVENDFITEFTSTGLPLDKSQQLWIGTRRISGKWLGNDGSVVNFSKFKPISSKLSFDCAISVVDPEDQQAGGYWMEQPCQKTQRAFVCKK